MFIEEEDDDGDSNVIDPQEKKPRLCEVMCTTCIFRPGNPMQLRSGRLRGMVEDAVRGGGFIPCHCTIAGPKNPSHKQAAICRGFYDKFGHRSNIVRIYERLGGFFEVAPETEEERNG